MKIGIDETWTLLLVLLVVFYGATYLVRLIKVANPKCDHDWISDTQICVLLCTRCPAMISYTKGTHEQATKLLERHYANQ